MLLVIIENTKLLIVCPGLCVSGAAYLQFTIILIDMSQTISGGMGNWECDSGFNQTAATAPVELVVVLVADTYGKGVARGERK